MTFTTMTRRLCTYDTEGRMPHFSAASVNHVDMETCIGTARHKLQASSCPISPFVAGSRGRSSTHTGFQNASACYASPHYILSTPLYDVNTDSVHSQGRPAVDDVQKSAVMPVCEVSTVLAMDVQYKVTKEMQSLYIDASVSLVFPFSPYRTEGEA